MALKIDGFKCADCNEPAKRDEEKSKPNWDVYPPKCPKCGGRLRPVFGK